MNAKSIDWNLTGLAGHDKHGNEISVRELVTALEGYETIEKIANLSESMRDAIAQQAAESRRVKLHNEQMQRQTSQLESALNNANARISKLLNEIPNVQRDAGLAALALYADPQNWSNPRNQHGEIQTDQRSVFIKGFHGYEHAMAALEKTNEKAA